MKIKSQIEFSCLLFAGKKTAAKNTFDFNVLQVFVSNVIRLVAAAFFLSFPYTIFFEN